MTSEAFDFLDGYSEHEETMTLYSESTNTSRTSRTESRTESRAESMTLYSESSSSCSTRGPNVTVDSTTRVQHRTLEDSPGSTNMTSSGYLWIQGRLSDNSGSAPEEVYTLQNNQGISGDYCMQHGGVCSMLLTAAALKYMVSG